MRNKTKKIYVGKVAIGGDAPVSVQSMTNTKTSDLNKTIKQISDLEKAGCDIVRCAVNTHEEAKMIPQIKSQITIPFIADIQYSYKLAMAAVQNGADCIRINPGNMGGKENLRELVHACLDYDIPMRIGVNSGSIDTKYIDRFKGVNADSLVHSCLDEVNLIESLGLTNMKLAVKSSNTRTTIETYEKLSRLTDYPLHIGVTEAGPVYQGIIKSSIALGALLAQGIGDTLRVSLTGDPLEEIKAGKAILKALNLLDEGIDLISCPTCSRTNVDLISLVAQAEKKLKKTNKNLTVAIMGCPVNGPGEAKEADVGIACGNGLGFIFKKGQIIKRVAEKDLLDALMEEIEQL